MENLGGEVVVSAASGGTVTTPNGGLALIFDPGDLSGDASIGVEEVTPVDPQVDILLEGVPFTGAAAVAYDLLPDGIVFNSPVDLTLAFDVTGLSPAERANLDIYKKIDTDADMIPDSFVPLVASCSISEDPPGVFTATCTAAITGLSIYAGIGWAAQAVPSVGPVGLGSLVALLGTLGLHAARRQQRRPR